VKARRYRRLAKVPMCWRSLHPPGKVSFKRKKNTALRWSREGLTFNIGRLFSAIRPLGVKVVVTYNRLKRAISLPIPVPIVAVIPIMIVVAISGYAPVNNAHVQGSFQAERHHRIAGNAHSAATGMATIDGADNGSNKAVVALGFNAVWVGSDGVPLAIDNH
jgi:hypothetical protein